jgi:hypothetical protein
MSESRTRRRAGEPRTKRPAPRLSGAATETSLGRDRPVVSAGAAFETYPQNFFQKSLSLQPRLLEVP